MYGMDLISFIEKILLSVAELVHRNFIKVMVFILALFLVLFLFLKNGTSGLIKTILTTVWFILPVPLSYVAVTLWKNYRNDKFLGNIKWTLLEIHVPREVSKSPAAMEMFFGNALYHKNLTRGFWGRYIFGAPWTWFSLEIASIDGRVHFYIRTPVTFKELIETQIYAQYPQAKVVEVEDYTLNIPDYTPNINWNLWGFEFKKAKDDFLPIRTYKDFGDELRAGVKEEYKIDPIVPLIEFLGSLPKGQQLWIQILVKQCTKTYQSNKDGSLIDFNKAALEFIDKMMAPFTTVTKNDKGETVSRVSMVPKHLEKTMDSINRNIPQYHFECGVRVITLSQKDTVPIENFINLIRSTRLIFRQYANPSINEFVRTNTTSLDFPWSDPTGLALDKIRSRLLNFYRTRTFFSPPIQYDINYPTYLSMFFPSGKPEIFVMSSEELATIYHFPGMVSETPSFKRVETKIAKPPSNLPL